MHVYLANFGLAKIVTESGATTSTTVLGGTPGFQAPEQLRDGKISPKCDVYALGGVITELFGCKPLWPKMSAFRIMHQLTVEKVYPDTTHLTKEIRKVTAMCFTTLEKRANTSELLLMMLNML